MPAAERVVYASAALNFFTAGCTFTFSTIAIKLEEEFDVSRGELSWIFSFGVALYFFLGPGVGWLAKAMGAKGARGLSLCGIAVMAIFLSAAATATSVYGFALAYIVATGFGVGLSYVPTLVAAQGSGRDPQWAVGVVVAGIGFGTLVLPIAAERLITMFGWRETYFVLAILTAAFGGWAAYMIPASPPHSEQARGSGISQALGQRAFWLIFLAGTLTSAAFQIPFLHLQRSIQDAGTGGLAAAALFGFIGIGNVLGRLLISRFGSRVRSAKWRLFVMSMGLGCSFTIWLFASTAFAFLLFALVFGVFYGGFAAVIPDLAREFFGMQNAGTILGLILASAGFGTLFGPTFAGYVYDMSSSYRPAVACAIAATILGALFIALARKPGPGNPSSR
jgi:MFS family permease